MKTMSVAAKGEQRNDEEVYTIVVSRGGVDKTRDMTRTEIIAKRDRENLRTDRLLNQLREAEVDEAPTATIELNISKSGLKAAEFRSIIAFMDSGD